MKYYFVGFTIFCVISFKAQDAKDIIVKSDQKYRGKKSAFTEMTISIVRPKWQRSMSLKSWSKGNDYSLILITSPPREKGMAFLKRGKEVWNWVPSIERTIKLPPSVMMQSWMGTDFTNDDLVKESSVVNDYNHELLKDTIIQESSCWKIELIPKPDAPVVWGKVVTFIDKLHFVQLRAEFYDEDGYLVNLMNAYDVGMLGGEMIARKWEMIPVEKKGNKTVMQFDNIEYDIPLEESFFNTHNMKKVR